MNDWIRGTAVQGVGWTLVHFVWEGLVIALVLAAVLRALRNRSAPSRYLAGCAAMLLMALAPVVTFAVLSRADAPGTVAMDAAKPGVTGESTARNEIETKIQTGGVAAIEVQVAKPHVASRNFSRRLDAALPWVVGIWVVGVLGLSGRLYAGWWQVNRLRRREGRSPGADWEERAAELARRLGVRRACRLVESAWVEVPTVIGWLKPVILLPASCLTGLGVAQLEAILAHELAHIRRHDYLVNLLQSAVETLLFYHPAMWWASSRVREERENCCDDMAVEVCGDRVAYARALATLEERRPVSAQFALAAGGGTLLRRVRRLLGHAERGAARPVWPVAGVVMVLLSVMFAMGMREQRVQARETKLPEAMSLLPIVVEVEQNKSGAAVVPVAKTNEPGPTVSGQTSNAEVRVFPNRPRPNAYVRSNIVYTGQGRQRIISTLNEIRVEQVKYPEISLKEALNDLSKISKNRAPDGIGINFFIVRPPGPVSTVVDPITGLLTAGERLDVSDVKVNVDLENVRLADVLDAITRTADRPIKYSVLDYAVIFSERTGETIALETRTFRVDPNTFIQGLQGVIGIPYGSAAGGAGAGAVVPQVNVTGGGTNGGGSNGVRVVTAGTNNTDELQNLVRTFLAAAGVDLATNSGKAMFFNDRNGKLTVRATSEDLELVEAALEKLSDKLPPGPSAGGEPRTFNIKAKFVQFTPDAKNPGLLGTVPPTNAPPNTNNPNGVFPLATTASAPPLAAFTGILQDPQFNIVLKTLDQRDGVDVFNPPQIEATNGLLAVIPMREPIAVYAGNTNQKTPVGMPGPTIEVTPYLETDGESVKLEVTVNAMEFAGYNTNQTFVPAAALPTGQTITSMLPLPIFKVRKSTYTVAVKLGETAVIGGLRADNLMTGEEYVPQPGEQPMVGRFFRSESFKKTAKDLMIFITPTVSDK